MDKLTAIKIKYIDGTYSDEIPLSAIAQNIDWDSSHSIVDILGNVDFSTKGSIQTQINNILAQKGAANGIATLDSSGQVPSTQLPSYVDDVLEYASRLSFPATGESGKIYVALNTNLTYRWTGSTYVEISKSLALGETSSTAYRGDHGKIAYDHATDSNRLTTAQSSGLYKIATTSEGHVANVTAVTKSDITNLDIPGSTKAFYGTCSTSASTQTKAVTLSNSTGWALVTGVVVAVKFTYTNTYNSTTSTPCKLNVNSTGAKNIYYGNTATPTGTNPLAFGRANCVNQYVYDGTNWVWCGTSADAMVGQGYGIDSRSSAATAVTAALDGYVLMDNGIVVIKFNYDVPASATLNINNQGAKAIYYNDAPIIDKTIKAGYTATFIYNNYYRLIAIDKGGAGLPAQQMTQAEYNALPSAEKMADRLYFITDATEGQVAEDIVYDNTSTSLTSNNVQDAIDELARGAVIELTLAQYNALTPEEQNNGTIYYIIDDEGNALAEDIYYDNTSSNLTSTNLQDAVDEIDGKMDNNVLYIKNIPVSVATSNTIVNYSDNRITPQHVLAEAVWASPSAITTDVTWSTETAGYIKMTGTCTTATTVNVVLVR